MWFTYWNLGINRKKGFFLFSQFNSSWRASACQSQHFLPIRGYSTSTINQSQQSPCVRLPLTLVTALSCNFGTLQSSMTATSYNQLQFPINHNSLFYVAHTRLHSVLFQAKHNFVPVPAKTLKIQPAPSKDVLHPLVGLITEQRKELFGVKCSCWNLKVKVDFDPEVNWVQPCKYNVTLEGKGWMARIPEAPVTGWRAWSSIQAVSKLALPVGDLCSVPPPHPLKISHIY